MGGGQIRAVVFDAYGTLVHIRRPTNPFRRLFGELGIEPHQISGARRVALTENFGSLGQLVDRLRPGARVDIAAFEKEIRDECLSVAPYPETMSVLTGLRSRGMRLGMISNLAFSYGAPLKAILGLIDHGSLSFEVGMMKPEARIYLEMLCRLGLPPEEVLMVGDNLENDVRGPASAGIQAVHLERNLESEIPHRINSLAGIYALL